MRFANVPCSTCGRDFSTGLRLPGVPREATRPRRRAAPYCGVQGGAMKLGEPVGRRCMQQQDRGEGAVT